jgi:hypothetical protein
MKAEGGPLWQLSGMSRVDRVRGAAGAGPELVQAGFGVDLGTKSPSEAV